MKLFCVDHPLLVASKILFFIGSPRRRLNQTFRYRAEDGDMVNVCQADIFAFSEMLRTA